MFLIRFEHFCFFTTKDRYFHEKSFALGTPALLLDVQEKVLYLLQSSLLNRFEHFCCFISVLQSLSLLFVFAVECVYCRKNWIQLDGGRNG